MTGTQERERELVEALRKSELDGEALARQRTLETVRAAYAEHEPRRRRRRWTAALVTAASLTVAAVIGLTPAGADFRQWVEDTIDPQSTNPRPELTRLPGGGTLLAQSRDGATVVQADGSRRFLGAFSATSWSPHGLNIATADGGTLAAVDPAGTLHWSISAGAKVRFPAWSQDLGYRVAYLSGGTLKVVAGDGTGDHALAAAANVAPAWRGQTDRVLAFVDGEGDIRLIDVDRGRTLGRIAAPDGVRGLAWSGDGVRLLAFSPRDVQVSEGDGEGLSRWRAPAGAEVADAVFLGDGERIALVQTRSDRDRTASSTVSIFEPGARGGSPQVIFRTPGRLRGLALSPDGSRLVVGWKDADQWLFLEPKPGGDVRAVDNVSAQLAPGRAQAPFAAPSGWCCSR